jgi:hypothetical protein
MLVGFHIGHLHHGAPASAWLSFSGAAFVFWWVTFIASQRATLQNMDERIQVRDISAAIGSALLLATLWMVLPVSVVGLASLALGMAWMELGFATRVDSFSLLGAAIACFASVQLFATDLFHEGKAVWLSNGIPFLAGLYLAWFRWRRIKESALPFVRLGLSLLALLLLTTIVYFEVSGSYRTVVWGMEGVALLTAGLGMRERTLRLEGLFLLLACILKLFLYDLRNLETIYRILSFIVLGIILLGVSWIYTRFRDRLQQYL